MSSSSNAFVSSSSRRARNLGDPLIFNDNYGEVTHWYNMYRSSGSTTIHTMQLRKEHVAPFHEFIMVHTRGYHTYRVDRGRDGPIFDTMNKQGVPPCDTIAPLPLTSLNQLDGTSYSMIELIWAGDKTIDLKLILDICFQIHNKSGKRYKLLTHNCYFFAQTIIMTAMWKTVVCKAELDKVLKCGMCGITWKWCWEVTIGVHSITALSGALAAALGSAVGPTLGQELGLELGRELGRELGQELGRLGRSLVEVKLKPERERDEELEQRLELLLELELEKERELQIEIEQELERDRENEQERKKEKKKKQEQALRWEQDLDWGWERDLDLVGWWNWWGKQKRDRKRVLQGEWERQLVWVRQLERQRARARARAREEQQKRRMETQQLEWWEQKKVYQLQQRDRLQEKEQLWDRLQEREHLQEYLWKLEPEWEPEPELELELAHGVLVEFLELVLNGELQPGWHRKYSDLDALAAKTTANGFIGMWASWLIENLGRIMIRKMQGASFLDSSISKFVEFPAMFSASSKINSEAPNVPIEKFEDLEKLMKGIIDRHVELVPPALGGREELKAEILDGMKATWHLVSPQFQQP